MKFVSLSLIILFVFAMQMPAQVEYLNKGNNNVTPLFYVDVVNFKSNTPGKTKVDFFVEVPYSEIQFRKRNEAFYASYNVTLTFMDKSKENILSERTWREQVNEKDFDRTITRSNFNLSYRSYDFAPGEYFFKCTLEDLDSRRSSSREFPFKVIEINDTLGLSDPVLISDIRKSESGESIVPNVSRFLTNKIDSLQFYFDVYSNRDRQIFLEYVLDDMQADKITKTLDPQKVKKGSNTIYHTLRNLNLKLGSYSLSVILKDDNMKEINSREKKFYSKIVGMPSSITDLDKAIEELLYIASAEERNYIEEGKDYNEKLDRFIEFWNKKKPNSRIEENPILNEYYRRIDYANANFKGLGSGWRSDMGMIYVTFGPPSNVERHPFDSDSKPYEIWDYNDLNRSFVFVDNTGFGDYRLYNPDYSRWPGYRP